MLFAESEMTEPVLEQWSQWWGELAPDALACEISGPGAIADLVAVEFSEQLAERQAQGILPIDDFSALQVLLLLKENPLTNVQLAAQLHLSRSAITMALRQCLERGAVRKLSGWRYQALPQWQLGVRRMVAVELKLRAWQKALDQAFYYQRWANEVWIVLAKEVGRSAEAAITETGTGLAYLDGELRLKIRQLPQMRPLDAKDFAVWCAAEQVLRRAT